MLLEYGGKSRLLSQARAASVSWHCFAAYKLGHDKRVDAHDIIVYFCVSLDPFVLKILAIPVLHSPAIISVLFASFRICIMSVSLYIVLSIEITFSWGACEVSVS